MKALVLQQTHTNPTMVQQASPIVGDGEIKIRLHAAGWNRRDHWIIHGKYPLIQTPVILGSDGCGVVEECPDNPDIIGQEVLICPSLYWGNNPLHQSSKFEILGMPKNGTMAEEIVLPTENVFLKPHHLQEEEAAAICLAGLTAWRALFTRANLPHSNAQHLNILITGIGGSTAIFALQFAKATGANVFVTSSSTQKIEKAVALGAKGGVLYTDSHWGQQLQRLCPTGFDIIIDSAGGEGFGTLVKLLGMGGRLVFFGGTQGKWPEILPQYLFFKQVSLLASTMGSVSEFREMCLFITKHQIKPVLDSVYSFADYEASLERLVHPDRFGKIILQIE